MCGNLLNRHLVGTNAQGGIYNRSCARLLHVDTWTCVFIQSILGLVV